VRIAAFSFALWSGCSEAPPAGGGEHCAALCEVLVNECAVNSFPSIEECESSCVFGEENGGSDILAYKVCIEAVVDCDTFEIVECENEHGW